MKLLSLKEIEHLPKNIGIRESDNILLLVKNSLFFAQMPSEKDTLLRWFHPKDGDILVYFWNAKFRENCGQVWHVAPCAFHGKQQTLPVRIYKKDLEIHYK